MSEYRGILHTPGTHGKGGPYKQTCPACRLRNRDYKAERAAMLRQLRGGQTIYSQCRDPEPDWVAVQRACDGQPQRLSNVERTEAVRILRARGLTYIQVAIRLRISDRAVARQVRKLRGQVAA